MKPSSRSPTDTEATQDLAIQAIEGRYLARALQQQRISVRGARTHNLKNIDT